VQESGGWLAWPQNDPETTAGKSKYYRVIRVSMVGITEIALFGRLQRALRKRGMFLHVADSKKRQRWGLGRYYIAGPNDVIDKDVNLEKLARKTKLLEPWETVSEG
jgi:hypothetical protein